VTGRHFIVATAGHIDHGKSSLVKALTGTDPDRLPEEKARQITIDLGFAHLDLSRYATALDPQSSALSVGIIDVPGHEDFVRNMIAGVGSIDLALLVVAADDGWMPQTEEHLQILIYLGVKRMIVALNKSDTGNPDQVTAQIREQLATTAFSDAPIVRTSAQSRDGIDALKQTLSAAFAQAEPQRDIGKPRLFIDRTFTLPGIGAVVTGTLAGGTLRAGQNVYTQPGNFRTRVRSVQSHHSDVKHAAPGMRTGLNLAEVPKGTPDKSIRRGYVVTVDEFNTCDAIDVAVSKSARLRTGAPAARPLKSGTVVHLHHGTARVPAVLILSSQEPLEVGQSAIAQLRFESPLLAFVGDRFVIRDRSDQHTIAGGIVLDPDGTPRSFRSKQQQRLLSARAASPDNVHVCVEFEVERRGPIHVSNLLAKSNFSVDEIRDTLAHLHHEGRIVMFGDIAANRGLWRALRSRVVSLIDEAHQARSERTGLDLNDLRAALPDIAADVLDAMLLDLCASEFVRHGSIIARASHRPTLAAHLNAIAQQILLKLAEKPFDPPGRTQLASDESTRPALRYLIEQKQVVELTPELVLSLEAFAQARDRVIDFFSKHGAFTVSEIREALGTSRRVAVPLLERFDRDRITRRVGDRRVLAAQAKSPGTVPVS
jgi:selenocysteine-specific elongation factor